MDKITSEHIEKFTSTAIAVIPEHGKRDTSIFRKNVNKLKADGLFFCAVCGCTEDLQVHHMQEFCFENITDFDKLKDLLMRWDTYGYSEKMKDIPLKSVEDGGDGIDDIRNLIVLCQPHHTGKGTGIHYLPLPLIAAQHICKVNPVPQVGESIDMVRERV